VTQPPPANETLPLTNRAALLHLAPRSMATWVRNDLEHLKAIGLRVTPYCYDGRWHGWVDRARIATLVARTDVSVSWFAYEQAYYAVRTAQLMRRPTVVIVGGFDVVDEENPTLMIPERRQERLRYALTHATIVSAFSQAAALRAQRFVPGRSIRVDYLGIEQQDFAFGERKHNMVVTVGYVRADTIVRKGIEVFVKAAAFAPEVEFVVVGEDLDGSGQRLRVLASPNVRFVGWVPHEELVGILQQAKVYCQASVHEGFGAAVAEAMLCGCTPVVSDRGALPEVVGDTGVYVPVGDPEALAEGIAEALLFPEERQRLARQRIIERFSPERRRQSLEELVRQALAR